MTHETPELKKHFIAALTNSIFAGLLIVGDKYLDNIRFRICVALYMFIPLYLWIRYLKAYTDYKIEQSGKKTGQKNEPDNNENTS